MTPSKPKGDPLVEVERSRNGRTGRARGMKRENAVAKLMREEGWVVGSMRTSAGGGDLIASMYHSKLEPLIYKSEPTLTLAEVRLVEVKSTARPFSHFLPADRREMLEVADRAGATAWLAHWPKNGTLKWIPSSEWPGA